MASHKRRREESGVASKSAAAAAADDDTADMSDVKSSADADTDEGSSAASPADLDVEVCGNDDLEELLTGRTEPIRELILKHPCDAKLLSEVLVSRRVLSFCTKASCAAVLPDGCSVADLLVTSAELYDGALSSVRSFGALTSLDVNLGADLSQLPALLTALNSDWAPALESLSVDDLDGPSAAAPLIRAVTRRSARLTDLSLTWYAVGNGAATALVTALSASAHRLRRLHVRPRIDEERPEHACGIALVRALCKLMRGNETIEELSFRVTTHTVAPPLPSSTWSAPYATVHAPH
jgi:hypothetical protein